MMLFTAILLLLTSFTAGFDVHKPARSSTALFVGQTHHQSWSEYKHDFVDPITPHEKPSGLHEPDPKTRAIADEFWLKQFEDDKDRLHDMLVKEQGKGLAPFAKDPTDETWDHYKHEFIDPKA